VLSLGAYKYIVFMTDHREVKLHVELDIEVNDPGKLDTYVQSWVRENFEDDPDAASESISQASEGAAPALQLVVDPDRLVDGIPGIAATEATWWAEEVTDSAETDAAVQASVTIEKEASRSDAEIVADILKSANDVPGLSLERLGYDESETHPDQRARSLREATALAGAMARASTTLVDELFDDICILRESGSVSETRRIDDLPLLYRTRYNALFAQKFLTVTVDLGTSFVAGFGSPTCVAQEIALRLVLDGVEALGELYPELPLASNWRSWAEDSLFEDLDHETLYDPSLDGISGDPDYAHLGMVDLDLASWFVPFTGRVVTLYAADADKPIAGGP
jgi:hypothetical protein